MRGFTTDEVEAFYRDGRMPPRPVNESQTLTEHLLCAVLTIMTGGLFAIVWAVLAARGKRPRQ